MDLSTDKGAQLWRLRMRYHALKRHRLFDFETTPTKAPVVFAVKLTAEIINEAPWFGFKTFTYGWRWTSDDEATDWA